MDGVRGARSFRDFELGVQRFTEALLAEARALGRPRSRRSRLARLYQENRPKAAREILEGPATPCTIPVAELHRYFSAVFAREDAKGGPRPANLPRLPRLEAHETLGKAFTPKEVKAALKGRKNNAPGQDEISFGLLRKRDPEGKGLATIFEGCRQFRRTPAAWKRATTLLIFKHGDPEQPSQWRPIALCNTMYKLYARCLAARISRWAQAGKALSPQQKGFQAQEGCAEHRFVLQSVLHTAKSTGRECAVALLDLADAYSSIPRCHIFEMLAEFGMPEDFLHLLRELYDGWTTTVKVRGEETAEIPLRTGLKQGCPLSAILFSLAIEPLLRFIDDGLRGFCLHGVRISVLAYVDDLVLVAENAKELQNMLRDATAAANWIGLRFNTGKCKSLHFKGGALQATKFAIQKEEVSCLKEGETVKYLGMPIGFERQPDTITSDFVADVDKIKKSRLERRQKADMLKRVLLPRTLSALREWPVRKQDLNRMDCEIGRALFLWAPYDPASAGDLDMRTLSDIEVVSHAFLLLTSPDQVVKAVANGTLQDIVRKSFARDPDKNDLALYLSGFDGKDVYCPLWTRARCATWRLNRFVGCQWIYNHELCVKVSKCMIYPKGRKTLAHTLKHAVSMF